MLLFDLANDLQMTCNLAYWKDNILNLKNVVMEVNYPLSSWSQKIDKTGLNSGWTGQQTVGVVYDISNHCLHLLDFLDDVGLLWDGGGEVERVIEVVPIIYNFIDRWERLISLNGLVCEGLLTLGINVIKVWLISFKIFPVLKNSNMQLNKSFFIVCQ